MCAALSVLRAMTRIKEVLHDIEIAVGRVVGDERRRHLRRFIRDGRRDGAAVAVVDDGRADGESRHIPLGFRQQPRAANCLLQSSMWDIFDCHKFDICSCQQQLR